jgi:uncharacterized protein (DUF849 family)
MDNSPAPVIIEAAINGATPKTRNPEVPRTPAEIADDGLRCLAAGAAIVHNHNDEPVVGGHSGVHRAEPYVEAWRAILAERPDALLYPTMASGGPHTTIGERYAHIPALAEAGVLRIGLVDPGSVNVGPTDREGLPAAVDATYVNTFADARHMFETCSALRLGPSISCFEPGFVKVALAYWQAGRMPAGALVKLYFGGERANFGLPPTLPALEAYLSMVEPTGLPWSVAVLGGDVVASGLARLALERGGHVRVGLEDYAGPRQPSNAELVSELVNLAKALGRPVATCGQAAEILGLPRGRA